MTQLHAQRGCHCPAQAVGICVVEHAGQVSGLLMVPSRTAAGANLLDGTPGGSKRVGLVVAPIWPHK